MLFCHWVLYVNRSVNHKITESSRVPYGSMLTVISGMSDEVRRCKPVVPCWPCAEERGVRCDPGGNLGTCSSVPAHFCSCTPVSVVVSDEDSDEVRQ